MYYTIYQTTNNINGKIYIGAHKTDNLKDGYLGSGKLLKRAISKYSKENFSKEYLHIFKNSEEMFEQEKMIVNELFVARKDTYNVTNGGNGGSKIFGDHPTHSPEHMQMLRQKNKQRWKDLKENEPDVYAAECRAISARLRETYKNGRKPNTKPHKPGEFKHSEESKQKISQAKKGKLTGQNNPSYGTCWIHNNRVSKRIEKSDLFEYLDDGWIKGRKLKFN